MRIGSQDILLPTTMVGNYPNPRWYDGHAFSKFPVGDFIYDSISREAFEDAVLAIVHDQETAGLDIISDGKVYGGDSPYLCIIYHYYERLTGYELSGPPIGLPIYSTGFAPTVTGATASSASLGKAKSATAAGAGKLLRRIGLPAIRQKPNQRMPKTMAASTSVK